MSQPARRLDERVTQLETEMAEVRFLATKAEKEVSDVQMVLSGHTGVLNAIREDQVEYGRKLAKVEKEMRGGFARVDAEFADVRTDIADVRTDIADVRTEIADVRTEMRSGFIRVDADLADVRMEIDGVRTEMQGGFAEMRGEMRSGFAALAEGQAQLADLVTRHIEEHARE